MNRRILILGVLALSCGGSNFTSTPNVICSPGETTSCPCPGGLIGAQDCNTDGTAYTACRCPDDQGGGGSTSTTSSSLGGGGDVGQGGMGGIGGTGGTSVGGNGGSGGVCVPNYICAPDDCNAHSDNCGGFIDCGNCENFSDPNYGCGDGNGHGFIPNDQGEPQPGKGFVGKCGYTCAPTPANQNMSCPGGSPQYWTCLEAFSAPPKPNCTLSQAVPPADASFWCCP